MGNRGKTPVTNAIGPEQLGTLCGAFSVQLAALSPRIQGGKGTPAQDIIEKPRTLRPELARILAPAIVPPMTLEQWHASQPKFWRCFGYKMSEEGLLLPDYKEGFNWSIAMPQGLKNSQALNEVCGRMFPVANISGYDLDKVESCRESDHDYTVLVRDRVEADEENKNKSVNTLGGRDHWGKFISLRERCVLEAYYYVMTGLHLDLQNVSLCPGSRGSGGGVSLAGWSGGRFEVGWCDPGLAGGSLRARSVVS